MPATMPGTTSGRTSSVFSASRPGNVVARQHQARGHAEHEPADHRDDADLQAREETR